jgi:hypothetical protein
MSTQTLLCTTLPDGHGRASVLFTPRLSWDVGDPVTKLSQLRTDFAHWVDRAEDAARSPWTLVWRDAEGHQHREAATATSRVSRASWDAIFGRELAVRSWRLPAEVVQRPIVSLPVAELEDWILETYEGLLDRAIGQAPRTAEVRQALAPMIKAHLLGQRTRGRMLAGRLEDAAADRGVKPTGRRRDDVAAALRAHDDLVRNDPDAAMLAWCRALLDPRTSLRPPADGPPELEFHEVHGALGDHPVLMRATGWVVDLDIPKLPEEAVAIRIVPPHRFDGNMRQPESWTAYDPRSGRAPTADPDARIRDGFLRLDQPAFEVVQIEAEAASLSLAAQTALEREPSERDSVVALSTRGLAVVQADRADELTDKLDRAVALQAEVEAGRPILLTAEDLVRGYAVDVSRGKVGDWRPLCARQVRYTSVAGKELVERAFDELPIQEALDEVDAEVADAEVHGAVVDERLFMWDGWSLAVPRPGAPMDLEGNQPAPVPDNDLLGVHATYEVPAGTLPRLTFNQLYSFRARVVDLAGNAVPVDDPQRDYATEGENWWRWQPLHPPARVPEGTRGPGEDAERMVTRTFNDANPSQPDVSGSDPATTWLSPTRVGVEVVQAHGVLDPPEGAPAADRTAAAEAAWQLLSGREGALPETVAPGGALDLSAILSDPLVRGVWVRAEDGSPSAAPLLRMPHLDHGEDWPAIQPVRIRVEPVARDQPPAAAYDAEARQLTVQLPPAHVARYHLRAEGDIWTLPWMPAVSTLHPQRVADVVERGHRWLDPDQPLELVHAVQRPLDAPQVVCTSRRRPDTTHVLLDGHWDVEVRSTGRVRLEAHWEEVENRPDTDAGFARVPRTAVLGTWPVPAGIGRTSLKFPPVRHEFGDTRFRAVTYTPRAYSRFPDCFAPGTSVDRVGPPVVRDALSSRRPDAPHLLDVVPSFRWVNDSIGVSRMHRRHTGLRVHLGGPWFSSGDGERLGVLVVGTNAPSATVIEGVTRWGADPTHPSLLPTRKVTSSSLQDDDGAGRTDVPFPDGGPADRCGVVSYPVAWDRERQLWYADVRVDTGRAWMPFVRLALVRYQPKALPSCELSPVVYADFHQLGPDRTATVMFSPGGVVHVTLRASDVSFSSEARNDNQVVLTVESRADRPQSDLGWWEIASSVLPPAPVGAPVRIAPTTPSHADVLWQANVTLADDVPRDQLRLVLREVEAIGGRHRTVFVTAFEL